MMWHQNLKSLLGYHALIATQHLREGALGTQTLMYQYGGSACIMVEAGLQKRFPPPPSAPSWISQNNLYQ